MKIEVKRGKTHIDLEALEAISRSEVDLTKAIPIHEVMRFENGTLITSNLGRVIVSGFVSSKEGKQIVMWINQGKHLNYSDGTVSVGEDEAEWKRTQHMSANQKPYVSYVLQTEVDKDSVMEANDPDFDVFNGGRNV